jgi:2,4'-dihydroxyacetophenone dioxygenase
MLNHAQTVSVTSLSPNVRPEINRSSVRDTEKAYWVPQGEGVSFLPLCFGVTQDYYVNLLRVRRSGLLARHRHSGAVHAQVLAGSWYYLEHDWDTHAGTFVIESPGETHTLVAPDGVEQVVMWFHVCGGYTYYDEAGRVTGIEDVFTKLEKAREHYAKTRLPRRALDTLVR